MVETRLEPHAWGEIHGRGQPHGRGEQLRLPFPGRAAAPGGLAGGDGRAVVRDNEPLAATLDQVAALLEGQGADRHRSHAYRRAAAALRRLPVPARVLLRRGGRGALAALPGVGEGIARALAERIETGRLHLAERLRGRAEPEALLATLPGIGRVLARRIHEDLGVTTLEELEQAARSGRLDHLVGLGRARRAALLDALAERLGPRSGRGRPAPPPVAELLEVDAEYRERARRGLLRTIAPRRFNPGRRAWLPILHATRGDRHYTAVFSNTARAHALGKTRDWVVLYVDDGGGERQATVVTETRGLLAGLRVVRGREGECLDHHRRHAGEPHGWGELATV